MGGKVRGEREWLNINWAEKGMEEIRGKEEVVCIFILDYNKGKEEFFFQTSKNILVVV